MGLNLYTIITAFSTLGWKEIHLRPRNRQFKHILLQFKYGVQSRKKRPFNHVVDKMWVKGIFYKEKTRISNEDTRVSPGGKRGIRTLEGG